jgi:nucleotide-binding universal stress UspA family protein
MNKMLVGLDGSPRERGVLDAAIALGRKTSAKLVLFRSVGIPIELPSDVYVMSSQDLPALLERRARIDLEKLASDVPPERRAGIRVIVGTPWQSIKRAAQEEGVDLIVIGSHGYDAIDHVLGTTAAKVVNHADRSVLVVRG